MCDDGNRVDGDGCSASCRIETDWACTGAPSECEPHQDPNGGVDGSGSDNGMIRVRGGGGCTTTGGDGAGLGLVLVAFAFIRRRRVR